MLADRERLLGADHPETLSSRQELAYSYRRTGRLDEAIDLFMRTVLKTRHAPASAYRQAGRLSEAIAIYESVHAGYMRVLSPGHPWIAKLDTHMGEARSGMA